MNADELEALIRDGLAERDKHRLFHLFRFDEYEVGNARFVAKVLAATGYAAAEPPAPAGRRRAT